MKTLVFLLFSVSIYAQTELSYNDRTHELTIGENTYTVLEAGSARWNYDIKINHRFDPTDPRSSFGRTQNNRLWWDNGEYGMMLNYRSRSGNSEVNSISASNGRGGSIWIRGHRYNIQQGLDSNVSVQYFGLANYGATGSFTIRQYAEFFNYMMHGATDYMYVDYSITNTQRNYYITLDHREGRTLTLPVVSRGQNRIIHTIELDLATIPDLASSRHLDIFVQTANTSPGQRYIELNINNTLRRYGY